MDRKTAPVAAGPHAVAVPDPRAFLARLRRRAAGAAVVAFGVFFGLTVANVVGVTAHIATLGTPNDSYPPSPPPTLAPGDFFGVPGGAASRNASGGAAPVPAPQPRLRAGGGTPVLSSGGS